MAGAGRSRKTGLNSRPIRPDGTAPRRASNVPRLCSRSHPPPPCDAKDAAPPDGSLGQARTRNTGAGRACLQESVPRVAAKIRRSDIRRFLLNAAAAAVLALGAAALGGCESFGDRTGSIRPAATAAPASDADLRAYAEACRDRYERNPGEKAASIVYARALRKLGRTSEAVAVMQAAAIKAPKDEQVLGEYGKALADDGQLAQAKDVLTRAYTPDDPKWDVLSVQGAVADRMGDHDAAMGFYREALKIAPNEPGVLTNMGLSLALTKQLPEAERVLRQAAASRDADATTRGDLALVLALEGKYAEAERVGETDLSPEAARANVESVKRMAIAGSVPHRLTSASDPAPASGSP